MREEQILLSISVAAYNVEKYLKKCIESCFSYKDIDKGKFEIIIVNDGSKDHTLQLASELQARYPYTVKIIDKENGGYGSTINEALAVAKGKYFKLLDGDDWFNSRDFSLLLKDLEDRTEDLVLTNYFLKYMNGETEEKSIKVNIEQLNRNKSYDNVCLLKNASITQHSAIVKTEVLRKNHIKILENCFYTDHQFMFYVLLYSSSFYYLDRNIYCYRLGRDGQSVSLKGILKHLGDNWKVLQEELSYLNERTFDNETLEVICPYIALLAKDVIRYHLLVPYSKEHLLKIKDMMNKIKEQNSLVYKIMINSSRPVRLLVRSKYTLYRLLRINEKRKYL